MESFLTLMRRVSGYCERYLRLSNLQPFKVQLCWNTN